MSKSKKESLTKAQKEAKKHYDKCSKIYLKVMETLSEEQLEAFDIMIKVFKENYATDQCMGFVMWMKNNNMYSGLNANPEAVFNSYIDFRAFQRAEGMKERVDIN